MLVIPKIMRAAAIDQFGGPEVLRMHALPVPEIDSHEVLIALHTSGVGPWDAEMREGRYVSDGARFPLVLGTDGAGTVAAVGSRIRRLQVDDRVYSYNFDNPKGGFYAEYVAVVAEKVARTRGPRPGARRRDPDHRAHGPPGHRRRTAREEGRGADHPRRVRRRGHARGPVREARGARVIATARGEDGLALVRHLGADAAVDGGRTDLVDVARGFEPGGIDALLGLSGGDALERCIDALRPGGRVAYPNGVEPEPGERPGIEIKSYDAIAGIREFDRLSLAVENAIPEVPIAAAYALAGADECTSALRPGTCSARSCCGSARGAARVPVSAKGP